MTAAPAILKSQSSRERAVLAKYWLPTQERWINDRSRLKLLEKCRRFGGSYAEAFAVVEKTSREKGRFDAWIGSRDMASAKLFINDCKEWCRKLAPTARDLGEQLIGDADKDLRAFEVEFTNGRIIHSLTSNPDAFASRQGYFTVDEAALPRQRGDLRSVHAIVQPAIMRGGSISYISTHRGSANYFNQLIEEIRHKGNPKKFSLHSINIVEAVKEGLFIKIKHALEPDDERKHWTDDEFLSSLRAEAADEEAWLQEYMCTPCDDAAALLTWDEILSCTERSEARASRVIAENANRYIGFDVARRKHLSVITQLAEHEGRLVEELRIELQGKSFAEQESILFPMIANPRVRKCGIDATGLGMQMAENATEKFGSKVKAVMFTAPVKLKMAVGLKRRFQDKTILVPDDAKLHYDLYSIKKENTAGDNILLRSEAGATDGHSDRFWSYALAVDATEGGSTLTCILC